MKYAFVFGVLSVACGYLGFTSENWLAKFVVISTALAFGGVAAGYAGFGARVFGKKPDGKLRLFSYLWYWPYFAFSYFSLFCFRLFNRENAFDQIDDNVYLGCRLFPRDVEDLERLSVSSVLDLTCEFSELSKLRQKDYCCIPILDTYAPEVEQLKTGAQWILQQAQKGPIYVHCALGHGRSATFVAAYLILSGKAHSLDEAVKYIAGKRPKIELHPEQINVLEELVTQVSRQTK